MFKILLYVCLPFSFLVFARQDAPETKIAQGLLRGKYIQTWKGRTFSAFTGIPYAKPPVGDLRFKTAVPAEPFKGVYDASKPHAVCPQMNVYFNDFTVKGDEDCLYLNVYTPQLASYNEKAYPVMFYIHGGGWMCGSANADLYGPHILLDKDIVLVTANYRLGALGFLSTGDNIVPGNNGLKDQNLALRWVKENIAQFGGDPERITVFGQSAGGASTHYHILSPLSRNLINGGIAHSGTALATWALSTREQALTATAKLAEFLNCPTISSKETVECLKNVDAYDIVNQDVKFVDWSYDPMIPFKPVVEHHHDGAFLNEDPIDIIKSGKAANVPLMTGFTTEDGALKSAILFNTTGMIPQFNSDFNQLAPIALLYHESPSKDHISNKIREFYFGDRAIDSSTKSELTDMFTDGWFLVAEDAAVRLHMKYSKQPVYYFLFGYRGSEGFAKLFGDASHYYGVCHCDELIYLLSNDYFPNYKPNESDKRMNEIMTTLWSNFARTGNPTPETDSLIPVKWEPVQSDKLEYYYIKSNGGISMDKDLNRDRASFWRNIPIDLRRERIRDEL